MDQRGMPGPMTQASRLKKDSGLVQHLIKAVPARTVEHAGIKILNLLYTANINMTHVFKHPKFYRIPRDKTDQAICKPDTREVVDSVRPGPGQTSKQQASSSKPQATQTQKETNCSSDKNQEQQASSHKLQAPSSKHQASSRKLQAP